MDLCALVPHRAARLSASSCGAAARTPSGGAGLTHTLRVPLAGALCAYVQIK